MGYEADFDAKIASYARANDYHTVIKDVLHQVALSLGLSDRRSYKVCVDSVPLAEKSLARLAGIGWQGRNSLIISPSLGSFIHLGELIVCEEVDSYSLAFEGDGCVGCKRCLLRCPTGAINPSGGINTTLCLSNRTVERASAESFDTHGWIFGCDECQTVCPYNRKAPYFRNPKFAPLFNPVEMTPSEWNALSDEEFSDKFGTTPLERAGIERLKDNLSN
jgi:epoxyqueuosine reductase